MRAQTAIFCLLARASTSAVEDDHMANSGQFDLSMSE